MKFYGTSKNLDLLAAAIVFCGGLLISVLCYASIGGIEQKPEIVLDSLPAGQHHFAVLKAGKCVGRMTYELSSGQTLEFSLNGRFDARFGNNSADVDFNFTAACNEAGQLSRSALNIGAHGLAAALTSRGVNPIELTLTAGRERQEFTRRLGIPGPLLAKKTEEGLYQLAYANLPGSNSQLVYDILAGALHKFKLAADDNSEAHAVCARAGRTALDLTPLASLFSADHGNTGKTLGGFTQP